VLIPPRIVVSRPATCHARPDGHIATAYRTQPHEFPAECVEKLAKVAQLERTGLDQQQVLNGWLALHAVEDAGSVSRPFRRAPR
jgi:phenolic acid decarboxylase